MKILFRFILSSILFIIFLVLLFNLSSITTFLETYFSESPTNFLVIIVKIVFWLLTANFINTIINLFFWDKLFLNTFQTKVPRLIKNFVTILLYIIAVGIIIAYVFNKPLSGFWTTSGALALIFGFALRDIISEMFAGLAVNIEKPFGIGDLIQIETKDKNNVVAGEVIDINWRSTRLKTEEKKVVIISNSLLSDYIITNYSNSENKIRFETELHIDYSISDEKAKRILLSSAKKVLKENGFYTEPEPTVVAGESNEYGVKYIVRYYIFPWQGINPLDARDIVNSSIVESLNLVSSRPAIPKKEYYYSRN